MSRSGETDPGEIKKAIAYAEKVKENIEALLVSYNED